MTATPTPIHKASRLVLHPMLCHKNFWSNTCTKGYNCTQLHFRRRGRKLEIFNAAANLNRIQRHLRNSILENMEVPSDCTLYIVDSQIDPADFENPLTFVNENILVARAIGLHPSTCAPKEYYELFQTGLKHIDKHFRLAYTGPFGGATNLTKSERYNAKRMSDSFTTNTDRSTALACNDDELLTFHTPDREICQQLEPRYASNANIFKTANRNSSESLVKVMKIVSENALAFATFDSKFTRASIDQLKMAFLADRTGRRCLIESDAPSATVDTGASILPLAVVNTIVAYYIELQQDSDFRKLGYNLGDFNALLVDNGFSCVPKHKFIDSHSHATRTTLKKLTSLVSKTLGDAYRTHFATIAYCSSSLGLLTTKELQSMHVNSQASHFDSVSALMAASTTPKLDANTTSKVAFSSGSFSWSSPRELYGLFGKALKTLENDDVVSQTPDVVLLKHVHPSTPKIVSSLATSTKRSNTADKENSTPTKKPKHVTWKAD